MCGIVGYIGLNHQGKAIDIGLEALKRLEYRGYDSAGLVCWDENKEIVCHRAVGRIANL
jgi:glucosamine--fructose-6-phosphate aminotransferase (isomerizing)